MKKNTLFLLALAVTTLSLQARFYQPIGEGQFYKYIENRHALNVALFIPYAEKEADVEKLDLLEETFRFISTKDRYRDADVAFINVYLQELPDLAGDLRLSIEKPTLMLFKDGQVVRVDGKIFKQTGYFNKLEIQDLIEEYFGKDINDRLAKKAQLERARLEDRAKQMQEQAAAQASVAAQPQTVKQVEYVTYPTTTQYVSYPRYRRSYWPGFGVGFGFGRGWGWGGRGWGRGRGRR